MHKYMHKSKKRNIHGTLCAIPTCKNTYKTQPNIEYHLFPKDDVMRKAWISKCKGMAKFNPGYSRICSNHFNKDDYIRDLRNELLGMPPRKILKPTSIPSLLLPSFAISKQLTSAATAPNLPRLTKPQKTKKKEIKKTVLKSTPTENESQLNEDDSNIKMSVLINEDVPDLVQEKVINWKVKFKNLQAKYAKLEQTVIYWKSKYNKLQPSNMKSKKTTKLKPKEQKEIKTTTLKLIN